MRPRPRGGVPRRYKVILALFLLWISAYGSPAFADGQQMSSVLSPFDVTDSHGVRVSQFALNINMGNAVTSTWKMMITPTLIGAWSIYSWSVGFIGWALDWTISLSWATYVTAAFNAASLAIRDNILAPIGATTYTGAFMSMLLTCAAFMVVLIARSRGTGSAVASALWSSLAAALAVGTLAMPVGMLAGGDTLAAPLTYTRGVSLEAVAAINGVEAPAVSTTGTTEELPTNMRLSSTLVDVFVRLPHQTYNYGAVMDGAKCDNGSDAGQAYTDALKKGPVEASKDTIRNEVGKCKKDYKVYADHADFWWFFVQAMFGFTGGCLTLAIGVLIVLTWAAVLLLCWAAFKIAYDALGAILSPQAWSPLTKGFIDVLVSLLQVGTGPVVLMIGLKVIKAVFSAEGEGAEAELAVKFVIADFMLLGLVFVLIVNFFGHKRWGKKMWRKLAEHTPAKGKKPTNLNVKKIASTGAAAVAWNKYRARAPKAIAPTAGATPRPRPVQSAATNMAVEKGLQVAAGAVTGGTGAVAVRAGMTAHKALTRYRQVRAGHEAGGLAGNAMVGVARAHNFVASRRNKALNAVDERVDNARVLLHGDDAKQVTRGRPVTTGSDHLDKVLVKTGRTRQQVGSRIQGAGDVVTAVRATNHRPRHTGTGFENLDKALTGVGRVQHRTDQAHTWATKPRVATPPTPRTKPTSPQRPTQDAPARRPAPEPTKPTKNEKPASKKENPAPKGATRTPRRPSATVPPPMSRPGTASRAPRERSATTVRKEPS